MQQVVTLRSEDQNDDHQEHLYYNNNNGATSSQLTFAQLKDQMQLAKTVDLAKLLLNNKWRDVCNCIRRSLVVLPKGK